MSRVNSRFLRVQHPFEVSVPRGRSEGLATKMKAPFHPIRTEPFDSGFLSMDIHYPYYPLNLSYPWILDSEAQLSIVAWIVIIVHRFDCATAPTPEFRRKIVANQ